eukprot:SAG11_NODE_404_length_9736_cov_20.243022_4_plen_149_part_00
MEWFRLLPHHACAHNRTGSSVYSYHMQYAFHNCPVAELINLSPSADQIVPYFGGLFPDEPLPANGFIDLPDKPGFGVTLKRSGLVRPYIRTEEEVLAQFTINAELPPPTVAHALLSPLSPFESGPQDYAASSRYKWAQADTEVLGARQ